MTTTRNAVPNYRRAYRRARIRERVLSANYARQQQAYRELEALYSAMTERATSAETALKMTQGQLESAQEQRDDWIERCEIAWNNLARALEVHDQYHNTCCDYLKRLTLFREVAQAARALRQHLPPDNYQTSDERALCAALDALQEHCNE